MAENKRNDAIVKHNNRIENSPKRTSRACARYASPTLCDCRPHPCCRVGRSVVVNQATDISNRRFSVFATFALDCVLLIRPHAMVLCFAYGSSLSIRLSTESVRNLVRKTKRKRTIMHSILRTRNNTVSTYRRRRQWL